MGNLQYTKKTLTYDVTEVDTTTLKIGGTAITKTASEINAMPNDDDIDSGTPVNAVAASGTLTLSGVAIDGETITIGDDVYEFCADTAQSLTAGSDFAIDITSYTTASQGTLSMATQPDADDTVTVGSTTYTWVGSNPSAGEIDIGADAAEAQANFVAAINGTDGINTANGEVTAAEFAVNDCVLTAVVAGTAGDSIDTLETFTAEGNIFDAATLGTTAAGVDATAANSVTAIVASITANDTNGLSVVDGAKHLWLPTQQCVA